MNITLKEIELEYKSLCAVRKFLDFKCKNINKRINLCRTRKEYNKISKEWDLVQKEVNKEIIKCKKFDEKVAKYNKSKNNP